MTESISEEAVHQTIGQVMHPAINHTLVELGMVRDMALIYGARELGSLNVDHYE